MSKFTPSTDTYSDGYRLDCLAKHYLATKPSSDIRHWLSKQTTVMQLAMKPRLNHFRKELANQGRLFHQVKGHQAQRNGSAYFLRGQQGISQLRSTLRKNLTNKDILK